MKKIFGIFGVIIALCFCFAGCGVSGSNAISAIKFDKAVIYVDENVDTELTYKVYPSTANNFSVTYNHANQSFFQLRNGNFCADREFGSVYITINAGNKTDGCLVVKKIYPNDCYLTHSSIGGQSVGQIEGVGNDARVAFDLQDGSIIPTMTMTTNSSTSLQAYGLFTQMFDFQDLDHKDCEAEIKMLDGEIYNFRMTSTDPSVVAISNDDILQVRATGKTGYSNISVALVDNNGNIKATSRAIRINVVNPVKTMDIYCDGSKLTCQVESQGLYQYSTNYAYNVAVNNNFTTDFVVLLSDKNGNVIDDFPILNNISISTLGNDLFTISKSIVSFGSIKGLKITLNFSNNTTTPITTTSNDKLVISVNYLLGETASENFVNIVGVISLGGTTN